MSDWFLYIAAALLIVTGIVHSLLGESRLIAPLLTGIGIAALLAIAR
jgi:hypothetical protein